MVPLSAAERERYARHLEIPGVGEEGQCRLRDSSVLLIGTGGLGSPAAMYLAAAGVGRIGLVDNDQVERSNLQRQILHGESSVGSPKLDSAINTLREINPHVDYVAHDDRFVPGNAAGLIEGYDLVVDGSDNFPTRFLSNDACYFAGKPLVYGSIFRFEGQITVFAPHRGGPCYRCMLPEMPPPGAAPSCAEAGVLGVLPGVIGSLQAMEAIKLLLGVGDPPLGKLLCYDGLRTSFREIMLKPDPKCRLCSEQATIQSLSNAQTEAGGSCASALASISVAELREILGKDPNATLVDVRDPKEHEQAAIPGSVLIPLGDLSDRIGELEGRAPIYVHCKSGKRSAAAIEILHRRGIDQAINVTGGIEAWLAQ